MTKDELMNELLHAWMGEDREGCGGSVVIILNDGTAACEAAAFIDCFVPGGVIFTIYDQGPNANMKHKVMIPLNKIREIRWSPEKDEG